MENNGWIIKYDNDTGPGDESFYEWWVVTNGTISFKCDSQNDAEQFKHFLETKAQTNSPAIGKEILSYWIGITECNCSSTEPVGACLHCDLTKVFQLIDNS